MLEFELEDDLIGIFSDLLSNRYKIKNAARRKNILFILKADVPLEGSFCGSLIRDKEDYFVLRIKDSSPYSDKLYKILKRYIKNPM